MEFLVLAVVVGVGVVTICGAELKAMVFTLDGHGQQYGQGSLFERRKDPCSDPEF